MDGDRKIVNNDEGDDSESEGVIELSVNDLRNAFRNRNQGAPKKEGIPQKSEKEESRSEFLEGGDKAAMNWNSGAMFGGFSAASGSEGSAFSGTSPALSMVDGDEKIDTSKLDAELAKMKTTIGGGASHHRDTITSENAVQPSVALPREGQGNRGNQNLETNSGISHGDRGNTLGNDRNVMNEESLRDTEQGNGEVVDGETSEAFDGESDNNAWEDRSEDGDGEDDASEGSDGDEATASAVDDEDEDGDGEDDASEGSDGDEATASAVDDEDEDGDGEDDASEGEGSDGDEATASAVDDEDEDGDGEDDASEGNDGDEATASAVDDDEEDGDGKDDASEGEGSDGDEATASAVDDGDEDGDGENDASEGNDGDEATASAVDDDDEDGDGENDASEGNDGDEATVSAVDDENEDGDGENDASEGNDGDEATVSAIDNEDGDGNESKEASDVKETDNAGIVGEAGDANKGTGSTALPTHESSNSGQIAAAAAAAAAATAVAAATAAAVATRGSDQKQEDAKAAEVKVGKNDPDPHFAEQLIDNVHTNESAPQAGTPTAQHVPPLSPPRVDYRRPPIASFDRQVALPKATEVHSAVPVEKMPIVLTFETGRQRITFGELEKIKEGYTFECANPIDAPVTIFANDIPIGIGELLDVEGRIGVRIIEFYDK
ncbi:MAG: FliM/FliN family flagellar motor switch protein [Puniceicoccales bacterium]|jgi:flagellar motor switch/type III secretory pathway protein FliN|nr:FliM/FliN family flagellar motor switch protein [Puniceicoccales bacterium]